MSASAIESAAHAGLGPDETIASTATHRAWGIGQSVVEVIARNAHRSRAYVVDEEGVVLSTNEFWKRERVARDEDFEAWIAAHSQAQQARIATAKNQHASWAMPGVHR